VTPDSTDPTELDTRGAETLAQYSDVMDRYLIHNGAQAAWDLVGAANGFIEESAPWTLAKEGDDDRLAAVLAALARCLARVTVLVSPFLPGKTTQVWANLGLPGTPEGAGWEGAVAPAVGGASVTKPAPMFPKT
jgi:methionyl-tRNA synthetase